MPSFNPDRMNIKDLTIEEPRPRIRVYSLGEHTAPGKLSWAKDRIEAKTQWDVFWGKSDANKEKWAKMKAVDYQQLYTQLTGIRVGPETPEKTADRLDGFEDDGVGYKEDIEEPSDCPPMPEQRNF